MVKVSEIIKLEDKDKVVIIGKEGDETYLRTILNKFTQHEYIYIQFFPYVPQMMKVKEYYHYLKFLGVREYERRVKAFDVSNKDPTKQVEVIIARWDLIPRLKHYRQDEKEYLEGESVL